MDLETPTWSPLLSATSSSSAQQSPTVAGASSSVSFLCAKLIIFRRRRKRPVKFSLSCRCSNLFSYSPLVRLSPFSPHPASPTDNSFPQTTNSPCSSSFPSRFC